MNQQVAILARVRGRVQGVFLRAFVKEKADGLGLFGYVKNLADGSTVEVMAEGKSEKIETLIGYLNQGPHRAKVDHLEIEWLEPSGNLIDFRIVD